MAKAIYTHDEAAAIVEMMEDILTEHDIRVPSPEDDERDKDDTGLYGSTYFSLLEDVEGALLELLEKHTPKTRVIPNVFSD